MQWMIDHGSKKGLTHQIADCVRRGVTTGVLTPGEQLPPAGELGESLSVDRNTVLAAYRLLRDEGVLEFRRGRGARVTAGAAALLGPAPVTDAAQALISLARAHGLGRADLIRLIEELT